jgi:hypothetical protein
MWRYKFDAAATSDHVIASKTLTSDDAISVTGWVRRTTRPSMTPGSIKAQAAEWCVSDRVGH